MRPLAHRSHSGVRVGSEGEVEQRARQWISAWKTVAGHGYETPIRLRDAMLDDTRRPSTAALSDEALRLPRAMSAGDRRAWYRETMCLRRNCLQTVTLASAIFALACGNDQRVPTAPTVVMLPPLVCPTDVSTVSQDGLAVAVHFDVPTVERLTRQPV